MLYCLCVKWGYGLCFLFFCSRISSIYLPAKQNHNWFISWRINFVALWAHDFSLTLSKWKFSENTFNLYVRLLYSNRKLTKVLKTYVDNAEKCGITDQLFKAMKALEYIFKFIVRSRILFNQWVQAELKLPLPINAPEVPEFYRASVQIAEHCSILEMLETVGSYFRSRVFPL